MKSIFSPKSNFKFKMEPYNFLNNSLTIEYEKAQENKIISKKHYDNSLFQLEHNTDCWPLTDILDFQDTVCKYEKQQGIAVEKPKITPLQKSLFTAESSSRFFEILTELEELEDLAELITKPTKISRQTNMPTGLQFQPDGDLLDGVSCSEPDPWGEVLEEDGETYFMCEGTCRRVMHYEDTNQFQMCGRCENDTQKKGHKNR
jgi:hypothetical protein